MKIKSTKKKDMSVNKDGMYYAVVRKDHIKYLRKMIVV